MCTMDDTDTIFENNLNNIVTEDEDERKLMYAYMESPDTLIFESKADINYDYHKNDIMRDKLFIQDPSGLFEYDFADSFRIHFYDCEHYYNLIITDDKNTYIINKIFVPNPNMIYVYNKKYFINYRIIICKCVNEVPELPPFRIINYNANEQPICCFLAYHPNVRSGLGDTIAWLNAIGYYMEKFPKCKMEIVTEYKDINELLTYTDLMEKYDVKIVKYADAVKKHYYATYHISYFYGDPYKNHAKIYSKDHSILEIGYDVLGIEDYSNEKPKVKFNIEKEKPERPYVCISSHSSMFYKEWYAKNGWELVIKFLKYHNYDVYAIDADNEYRYNLVSRTETPKEAIDDTGNKPLIERVRKLINADFYVGGPSGLSWLAWWCDIPVVLISGFSLEQSEFRTPYRIINKNVCHGCWNDHNEEYNWNYCCCPRNGDSPNNPKFLICSATILPTTVIDSIKKIPQFKEHTNGYID